jgi:hypothetical protein
MSDPTIAPGCTCAAMCPEPEGGCCDSCAGGYRHGGEMCWDCRGTGHPHPLEDPDCPEHAMTDGPGLASSPDAVTVWCAECGGPANVVEVSTEDEVWGDQVVGTFHVRRLDCGHEEVTR